LRTPTFVLPAALLLLLPVALPPLRTATLFDAEVLGFVLTALRGGDNGDKKVYADVLAHLKHRAICCRGVQQRSRPQRCQCHPQRTGGAPGRLSILNRCAGRPIIRPARQ
jgi:hypothetical protein